MPTPTIPKGEEHFFPIIYEGNGGGQRVGKFVPFTDQATIANSCIFNRADSPNLNRTISSGSQRRIFTLSCWVKLGVPASGTSGRHVFFEARQPSNSETCYFMLDDNGALVFQSLNSGGSNVMTQMSNRKFQDTSKWYHFMVAVDTTQSTNTNKIKMYVDGDQITSLSYSNYDGGTNYDLPFGNDNSTMYVAEQSSSNYHLDGYLAEVNVIDNQALLPASFGITDTSTMRWIPKTVEPFPTTTTDIAVTVVDSGGNKFAVDGVTQGTVTLIEGATYKFDQSDSSNATHPLRFSTTSDGTHNSGTEYTTGVTTAGTPGSSGAYTQITVATGAPTLYYYCSSHSGMGGTANTQDQYGGNGFRLKFQDSSALGDDTSGNGNDLTAANLTASDQTIGSPTSNYSIFTTNGSTGTISLAEGNLKPTFSSSAGDASGSAVPSTFRIPVGKWYFEYYIAGTNSVLINMAVAKTNTNFSGRLFTLSGFKTYYPYVRSFYEGSSELVTDTDMPIGEDDTTVGVYIERKSDGTVNLWAGDDQASKGTFAFQSSMNPATGANAVGNPFSPDDELRLYIGNEGNGNYSSGVRGTFNFGQLKVSPIDSGTNLTDYTSTAGGYFRYQPVTGFKALQQDNMPTTDKGVSGLTWTKDRDAAVSWMCIDSSRTYAAEGVPGAMNLNNTNREYGQVDFVDGINKFLKGGFAVATSNNTYSYMNKSGNSNVSYSWVANSGTTATNTTGSITSTVQANTTAGFSIVQYVGTGSSGSVGHGLSAAPEFMIFKDRDNDSTNWRTFHTGFGNITTYQKLNSDDGYGSASMWGTPTASAFIIGGTGYEVNESSTNYVAYCWHGVDGFSKFGRYTGNNSSDGTFIYTGFKPAFVMIKGYTIGTPWIIWDNLRSPFNPGDNVVYPNITDAEATSGNDLDILSNGFKCRGTAQDFNASYDYLYMAWAENPFVGDGTNPVTAR